MLDICHCPDWRKQTKKLHNLWISRNQHGQAQQQTIVHRAKWKLKEASVWKAEYISPLMGGRESDQIQKSTRVNKLAHTVYCKTVALLAVPRLRLELKKIGIKLLAMVMTMVTSTRKVNRKVR